MSDYEYEDDYNNNDLGYDYTRPIKVPNCRSYYEDSGWSMPDGCEECNNQNPHECDKCSVMR